MCRKGKADFRKPQKGKKMKEVFFNGVLNCGAFIYGASVTVREDYTMTEIVKSIKDAGYKEFMLEGMKRLAKVI